MKRPDPVRWLEPGGDDAPEDALELLRAAGPGPDAAAGARIWRAIEASTAAPPPPPASHTAPAAPVALKLVVVGALIALAGSSPWLLPQPSPRTSRRIATVQVAPRAAPPPTLVVAPAAPPPATIEPRPVHRATRAAVPPVPAVTSGVAPRSPVPAAPPAIEPPVVATEAVVAAPATHDVATEQALITAIARARTTNPARALALVDEHARRFPSGVLTPEREALAVDVLASLGRRDEAIARADAFLRAYPHDTPTPRVRETRDRLLGHDR